MGLISPNLPITIQSFPPYLPFPQLGALSELSPLCVLRTELSAPGGTGFRGSLWSFRVEARLPPLLMRTARQSGLGLGTIAVAAPAAVVELPHRTPGSGSQSPSGRAVLPLSPSGLQVLEAKARAAVDSGNSSPSVDGLDSG